MAFSVRVSLFSPNSRFNFRIEHGLIVGNEYNNLRVADLATDYSVGTNNGNAAMIQHITQYKDKLYYNRFNQNQERNLRVFIDPTVATTGGWTKDTSFWLGSFNEFEAYNANGGPHNLRVMNGSLYFIYKKALYKFTDNSSSVATPVYDYRAAEHYVPEGVKDWSTCLFDYGYPGLNWRSELYGTCPFLGNSINETIKLESTAVYPNPASTQITIKLDNFEIEEISIYNIHGAKVKHYVTSSNVVSVEDLSAGQYLVGIITKDGKFVHSKFIKN
jgi:hypothetical protein